MINHKEHLTEFLKIVAIKAAMCLGLSKIPVKRFIDGVAGNSSQKYQTQKEVFLYWLAG